MTVSRADSCHDQVPVQRGGLLPTRPPHTLVACVGNVLRRDDGFGVVVATRLLSAGGLPPGVDIIETGIGGLGIVQQLMDGYQALIVVDAVDRGTTPGTVFILEPDVADPSDMPFGAWREQFSNLHLAEPSRVFLLARALGILPQHVFLVGCQPADVEEVGEGLSESVAAAVDVAVARVHDLILALPSWDQSQVAPSSHSRSSED